MADPGNARAEWAAFFAAGLMVIVEATEYASAPTWTGFAKVTAAIAALYAAGQSPNVQAAIGNVLNPALQALRGEGQRQPDHIV